MGRGNGSEQRFGLGGKLDQRARHLEILRHHRKGFFFSIFAIAQRRHGSGIPGIARQVISAQAFDGENFPGSKKPRSGADASFASLRSPIVRAAGNNSARMQDKLRAARENAGRRDRNIPRRSRRRAANLSWSCSAGHKAGPARRCSADRSWCN